MSQSSRNGDDDHEDESRRSSFDRQSMLQCIQFYSELLKIVVYYESINRELKRRLIYEYRCYERLKTKNEESTRLTDTGLVVELEHLKTKKRLKRREVCECEG